MRPGVRIGVDVGSVRVGVAASDATATLASPVTTLARDARGRTDVDALVALVRDRAAVEVIVGFPRTLAGRSGKAADAARDYARALARRLETVPVRLFDERLSTVAATKELRAAGVPGRAQRRVVDAAAAVIVLQGALDSERATGRAPGEAVMVRA